MAALTTKDMLPAIGTEVRVRFESLYIDAAVRDVKYSYGRPRFLIAPKSGSGEQWVELSRIVNPARSNVKFDCCPGLEFHSSNCPMVR